MNRIELAENRYRELISDELRCLPEIKRGLQIPISTIEGWLEEYVVPAVEEVYQRPLFREHVTWPQRRLGHQAESPERHVVLRVDDALVAQSCAMRRLLTKPSVTQALKAMTPADADSEVRGTVVIGDRHRILPRCRIDKHTWIPYYVRQVACISERPWTDLVCMNDYFRPLGGMMLSTPLPAGMTEGEMLVHYAPHLFFVGDSITRCMMQRVRAWLAVLMEARSFLYEAIRETGYPFSADTAAEQEMCKELQESFGDLQALCLTGTEARMREACIALVQVYAEFHPKPDLGWLGISNWAIEASRGYLRGNLRSMHNLQTLDRIAAAVGELKFLYRESEPQSAALDQAIATGGLVLRGAPKVAYWEAAEIRADWGRHKQPWNLLWQLAIKACHAAAVGNFDLYTDGVSNSTIANRWRRLKSLLPPSLHRHVVPGEERATYRLDLPINRIHVFPSPRSSVAARRNR